VEMAAQPLVVQEVLELHILFIMVLLIHKHMLEEVEEEPFNLELLQDLEVLAVAGQGQQPLPEMELLEPILPVEEVVVVGCQLQVQL